MTISIWLISIPRIKYEMRHLTLLAELFERLLLELSFSLCITMHLFLQNARKKSQLNKFSYTPNMILERGKFFVLSPSNLDMNSSKINCNFNEFHSALLSMVL